MRKLRGASGARSAPPLVCCLLCADCPLAASSTSASAWCRDVMREGSGRHLGVIVSADRVSQMSVNDGVWDGAFTCLQVLGWRGGSSTCPRCLIPGTSLRCGVWSFPACQCWTDPSIDWSSRDVTGWCWIPAGALCSCGNGRLLADWGCCACSETNIGARLRGPPTELEGQLGLEALPDGDLAILRRADAARARTSECEHVLLGIQQNT